MYKNVYSKIDMPHGVWVSVVTLSTLQSSSGRNGKENEMKNYTAF